MSSTEAKINDLDGVFRCLKDKESRIIWADRNFYNLIASRPDQVLNVLDPRSEHVEHDKQVLASGLPQLNLEEVINVPNLPGKPGRDVPILTQKGMRYQGKDRIGISVNFSFKNPEYEWITQVRTLQLDPIELGGFFKSQLEKPLYSTNYYLLPVHDVLRLHKLDSDEVWFFNKGRPITLHIFKDKTYSTVTLGPDNVVAVAPAGSWFGGVLADVDSHYSYCLVSCSLVPAWTPASSHLPPPALNNELVRKFPEKASIVNLLLNHPPITYFAPNAKL
jgi:predicted cupin superfamily sugar epimerase